MEWKDHQKWTKRNLNQKSLRIFLQRCSLNLHRLQRCPNRKYKQKTISTPLSTTTALDSGRLQRVWSLVKSTWPLVRSEKTKFRPDMNTMVTSKKRVAPFRAALTLWYLGFLHLTITIELLKSFQSTRSPRTPPDSIQPQWPPSSLHRITKRWYLPATRSKSLLLFIGSQMYPYRTRPKPFIKPIPSKVNVLPLKA